MSEQARSGDAEAAKNLGNAHRAAGEPDKAIDCYRQSLSLAPDYLPSLYNLGLTLHELNRLVEAEAMFCRAREVAPRDPDVLAHLGALQCKLSRFSDAVPTLRSAVDLAPADARVWLWLATACLGRSGGVDEAVRCLRRCIALDPQFADAYGQLGVALRRQGDAGGAAGAFREALRLQPGAAEAVEGLGQMLQDEGKMEEALAHYRAAVAASPAAAQAHNGLGCVLTRMDRLAPAVEAFRRAISLQPDFADALHNLGIVLGMQGVRDEALRWSEEALRLRPGDGAFRERVLFEKQNMCDWADIGELCEGQRRHACEPGPRPSSPFSLLSIPSTRAEQLQCARIFARFQQQAVAGAGAAFSNSPRTRERLRIGYLSADFHEHATAYLTAELFELHDRGRFEILAYSYGPDDASPMRGRLKRAFDRFIDISALSHRVAAATIHADGTDILVDLKGYTEYARTGIVALRPAPVQVNYLGFPGTMGADFIDYLIADRFVVPEAHAPGYSERLVWLPGGYQVNDRKRRIGATPARTDLGLPPGGFVFCCFNQAYKILPEVFSLWMRLLQAVPGSVLWLLESNAWARRNLEREARGRGVEPARLIFAPKLPLERHLGRLRAADLFLDTLPCNAHTTASDALWAGLPVLTAPGDTFASRVAGSLLTAAGLPELIADSLSGYEALALALARDPARLAALRKRLAGSREASPLFDAPGFVRNIEAAYEAMWRHFLAGHGPQAIRIQAQG